ncbi:EFR1 family ferrodoxin [Candidatus Bipolaricaulota bacterium]|nr:EFR1 family ferrodoxin [Candidatus Bipolaricaulota bacterium]
MKTLIYYFTGTGNSLAVARRIAAGLGDAELVGIPSLRDTARIVPEAPRIGIVCPVHGFALPGIVSEFIGRLDPSSVRYAFIVLTPAGTPGGALIFARRAFRRAGKDLDAGFTVRMPSNDLALSDVQSPTKQRAILARADEKLAAIIRSIAAGEQRFHTIFPLLLPFAWLATVILGSALSHHRHALDRRFFAEDSCTGCGICVQVCPAENIVLVDGRPQWKHRCEACMACINYCPARAIQFGKHTAKRGRYHHPEVSAPDLAAQKLATSSGSHAA